MGRRHLAIRLAAAAGVTCLAAGSAAATGGHAARAAPAARALIERWIGRAWRRVQG